jgi:hypothetical protein
MSSRLGDGLVNTADLHRYSSQIFSLSRRTRQGHLTPRGGSETSPTFIAVPTVFSVALSNAAERFRKAREPQRATCAQNAPACGERQIFGTSSRAVLTWEDAGRIDPAQGCRPGGVL